MVNKQITEEFLLALKADSHSEILGYLNPDCQDAIILCQKYPLMEGADVAIWENIPGKTPTRTVCGTGPVRGPLPFDLKSIQISQDITIPRSERMALALAQQMNEIPYESPPINARLLIDNVSEVDAEELANVKEILTEIQDGCENVMGGDLVVWALKLEDGILIEITKSGDGTIAFDDYWKQMNRVLDLAGLREFP